MGGLWSVVPVGYRVLVYVGILLCVYGAGWYNGFSGEHDRYVAYEASVKAAAAAQERAVEKQTEEQNEQTKQVATTYAGRIRNLEWLLRMQKAGRNPSPVPSSAVGTQGSHGASGESSSGGFTIHCAD